MDVNPSFNFNFTHVIYCSKSQMREYLEDCRSVIAGLSAALKGVPVDQGMLVKRELRRKKIDTEEPTAEMRCA